LSVLKTPISIVHITSLFWASTGHAIKFGLGWNYINSEQ
jgi:hypothetical protein